MTVSEAKEKICPFMCNHVSTPSDDIIFATVNCACGDCMAWEWDLSDELDIELTNKYASESEIKIGRYKNPFFKLSKNKGFCKRISND